MPKLAPETHSAKRTHILDAAERCFARSGFHRATMNEICKEARVSPGAFYVYFASKEELIAGLCERECATFADMLAGTADAEDLVSAITGLAGQCPILQSPEKLKLHADIAAEIHAQRRRRRGGALVGRIYYPTLRGVSHCCARRRTHQSGM